MNAFPPEDYEENGQSTREFGVENYDDEPTVVMEPMAPVETIEQIIHRNRREAWEEGYDACHDDMTGVTLREHGTFHSNPYEREES